MPVHRNLLLAISLVALSATPALAARTYTVRAGDTVYRIARANALSIDALRAANPALRLSEVLQVGQRLTLPDANVRTSGENRAVVKGTGLSVGWLTPVVGVLTTPFLGVKSRHPGIDLAAPVGTPIKAARAGVVREAKFDEKWGWGGTVVLDHGDGFTSRYSHNSAILVKPGDRVGAGQVIARVGSTGHSTGPHLDYRVYKDGVPVDPAALR